MLFRRGSQGKEDEVLIRTSIPIEKNKIHYTLASRAVSALSRTLNAVYQDNFTDTERLFRGWVLDIGLDEFRGSFGRLNLRSIRPNETTHVSVRVEFYFNANHQTTGFKSGDKSLTPSEIYACLVPTTTPV